MTHRTIAANEVQKGDALIRNGETIHVKFVDVNPKSVYIKSISGRQFSFPALYKVEVI